MPTPSKTLKLSALAVVLLPMIAATQQASTSGQAGAQQGATQGNPPDKSAQANGGAANQNGPANNGPANQQGTPGNGAANKQGAQTGAANTQAGAKGAKQGTTTPGAQTHPAGGGTPVEVGDPWDSLKLDSKVRIKLSFRNANIDNVIALIQQASHVTIVKDPALVGPITVTTADKVGLSEAFHVFNSVLKLKGYELSRDRKILVITKIKPPPPPPQPQPQIVMPQVPPADPNATVVKFYPLQFANANQVARAINEVFQSGPPNPQQQQFGMVFGGPGGQQRPPGQGPSVKASFEEFSNSVIVNAPAAQQVEVEALIKEIDKRQNEPQHTKTYKLVYATSTEIVSSVNNVLTSNLGKGKGAKQQDNNPFAFFFFGGGQNQNQNLAVADARTNTITVTGTDDLLAIADKLILDLDQRMPFTGTTFVFKLVNARADTVANLLTAAFGQRQGSQNNNNGRQTITPTNNNFNNNSTTAGRAGSPSARKDDTNLPLSMQDPNAESGQLQTSVGVTQGIFGFFDGGNGNGGRRQPSNGQTIGHDQDGRVIGVHDLTGQVTAIADPNTNSVIIVTQPDNVDLIKDVLDQLDKIPEQVMIQTVIVEATLDKSKQFGLEWKFAQNKAFGANGATGNLSQGFGLQNSQTPLNGFSYALTDGDLSAFFNMLQTDTKFQVLSTPRIFTSNNMEAQINISQSIPYVTSTFENSNGTTSFNYSFQDVGIVLTVTPHITSNGYVTMDVTQTANDLQSFTSFNAPIINQREAETTVSAKDGQTIILGGMIRSQISSTVNKVPLLGDIPILGNLFRSTNTDHQKTELLVFLTPRVVRDPAEAKKLKDESQGQVSPDLQKLMKDELKKQQGQSTTTSTMKTGG